METVGYQSNYFERRKKIKIAAAVLIISAILVVVFLNMGGLKSHPPEYYIGKVVSLQGSVNEIGRVEKYKPGKFIVLKLARENFGNSSYYPLQGKYRIKVLADNVTEYLAKNRPAETSSRPARGEPAAGVPSESAPAGNEVLSPSDSQTRDAVVELESSVRSLISAAGEMDVFWKGFRDSCQSKFVVDYASGLGYPPNNYGRDWFVFWNGQITLMTDAPLECWKTYNDLLQAADSFKSRLGSFVQQAKDLGVDAEKIREICRRFRLDWQGWQ